MEDVATVGLHGAGADDEMLGDFLVAHPRAPAGTSPRALYAVGKLVGAGSARGWGGAAVRDRSCFR